MFIEQYTCIRLFLDNDNAGRKITQELLASGKPYIDESNLYRQQKDLNDYVCHTMNSDHKSNVLKRELLR
ncbi:toprim domain-containing protein [Pedobacter panaciterrae]